MKYIIIFLMFLSSVVMADEKKISDLEKRISQLETNKLSIPKGLFITGEVEGYYDDRTYDSGLDSRAELQIGITHKFNNCLLYTSPSPRDRQKSRMPSSD